MRLENRINILEQHANPELSAAVLLSQAIDDYKSGVRPQEDYVDDPKNNSVWSRIGRAVVAYKAKYGTGDVS